MSFWASSILIKFYFPKLILFNPSSNDCLLMKFDTALFFNVFCVDLNFTKFLEWLLFLLWLFDTYSRTYFLSFSIFSLSSRISTVRLLLKLWMSDTFYIESSSILIWFVEPELYFGIHIDVSLLLFNSLYFKS